MKKFLSIMIALLVVVSLACTAFATNAPSKGGTTITIIPTRPNKDTVNDSENETDQGLQRYVIRDKDGNEVDVNHDCLVLIPVSEAEADSEVATLYNQIKDGSLVLPYGEKFDASTMVVRHMFELHLCDECEKALEEPGVVLELTIEAGVNKASAVSVMTYTNGTWEEIAGVEVERDGDVLCTFEHLCPVAMSVGEYAEGADVNPLTGDIIMMWVGIMVVAAAAIVLVVKFARKKAQ